MLTFSCKNSKMNKLSRYLGLRKNQVVSFDLPAGYSCPAARLCRSYSDKVTGKITDGKEAQFRCYATSLESAFTSVRKAHWSNFDALKHLTFEGMVELISNSLPKEVKVIRIHSSGDFFNKDYFQAWVEVAKNHPEITFFGYTKVLPYIKGDKSDNFHLVYSFGGKYDNMVTDEPVAYVVNTVEDGLKMGLPVSCQDNPVDDFDYVTVGRSFALALHGTQRKGSKGLVAEVANA